MEIILANKLPLWSTNIPSFQYKPVQACMRFGVSSCLSYLVIQQNVPSKTANDRSQMGKNGIRFDLRRWFLSLSWVCWWIFMNQMSSNPHPGAVDGRKNPTAPWKRGGDKRKTQQNDGLKQHNNLSCNLSAQPGAPYTTAPFAPSSNQVGWGILDLCSDFFLPEILALLPLLSKKCEKRNDSGLDSSGEQWFTTMHTVPWSYLTQIFFHRVWK